MRMFVIFDLDDTLADTSHRQPILDEGDRSDQKTWRAFFDACDKDSPKTEIISVLEALASFTDFRVEFWTGRSEQVREKTEAWLKKHVKYAEYIPLRMRPEGDTRPDTAIKGEWVEKYGKPDLVFDDRNKMVRWWRDQGITCCQVQESDF